MEKIEKIQGISYGKIKLELFYFCNGSIYGSILSSSMIIVLFLQVLNKHDLESVIIFLFGIFFVTMVFIFIYALWVILPIMAVFLPNSSSDYPPDFLLYFSVLFITK